MHNLKHFIQVKQISEMKLNDAIFSRKLRFLAHQVVRSVLASMIVKATITKNASVPRVTCDVSMSGLTER